MAEGLFVTGAGTEIGKTLIACALVHQLKDREIPVRALKPVITGFDPDSISESDTGRLLLAAGEELSESTITACSPWRFADAIAPSMAARRAGRPFAIDHVMDHCRKALDGEAFVVIEGVGGVMAPVTDDALVLDWMKALGLPAVLVAGSYLGAISHALTAARVLLQDGVPLAGVAISESAEQPVPLEETAAAIRSFLPELPALTVPRIASGPRMWESVPDLMALLPRSLVS